MSRQNISVVRIISPDGLDTILTKDLVKGGLVIKSNYIFANDTARDTYFTANKSLLTNLRTYVLSGTAIQLWKGATNPGAYDETLFAVTQGEDVIHIKVGDEATDLTAATDKHTFRMPYAFNLTGVRASVETGPTGAVQATGTVTCATAIADDTVTVNGLLYTGVAGVKADNTEFSIDTGNDATATDLADSITNDTRVGTDVAGIDQTAAAVAAVVTITASIFGTAANSIGLASSDGGTLAVSGANLAGGVDTLTVDINDSGTTVLSTKVTIDNSEKTSTTALIPAVISDAALGDDAEITIDIDAIGDTIAGKGLKVTLYGHRV